MSTTKTHLLDVPQTKCYRSLNHGPTVLVSAKSTDDSTVNAMAAAWNVVVDFPNETRGAKVSVILDKISKTRDILVESGFFCIQVPCLRQLKLVNQLGTDSLHKNSNKLADAGAEIFYMQSEDKPDVNNIPLVDGCVAYLLCKLIPNEHNQNEHDLFIGEVLTAYADDRVWADGRWLYETQNVDKSWRTLHHVAGGNYFILGEMVSIDSQLPE